MKDNFSQFTNLYSLTKTLRFELKPTPETQELLKKTNLDGKTSVQIDQEIHNVYQNEMKPLFDRLHEQFIIEALHDIKFNMTDLQDLENALLKLKKISKDRRNNAGEIKKLTDRTSGKIPLLQKILREQIVEAFNSAGEDWKKKYPKIEIEDKGYKILTNAKILDILLDLYPEKNKAIETFRGFFTYFTGFNKNRENYYTSEEKATGIASRIINENFVIFVNNKQNFVWIAEKIPQLREYENDFTLESYRHYLTQSGIEAFNENVIGKINIEKNLFLQQENAKPENKHNKLYLPNLQKLDKQIGCRTAQQKEQERKGESMYPKYLDKSGFEFQIAKDSMGKYRIWECLGYLNDELRDRMSKVKENYQKFFKNWQEENYDLDKIWFSRDSFNIISAKWFGGDNWSLPGEALKKNGIGRIEQEEYKMPAFVSLLDLKSAIDQSDFFESINKKFTFSMFLSLWQREIIEKFSERDVYMAEFEIYRKEPFDKKKKQKEISIHTQAVKNLLDNYLNILRFTKYHNLKKKGEVVNLAVENKFYDEFNEFWEENIIVTYYKAFQTTLMKKSYSQDKIKLNFENGSLLGGFSDGQEKNKAGVILQNGNAHYLGILREMSFFRTDTENSLYETTDTAWSRLILTNLKFQTLAGKGFLNKYEIKYGELGRTDPMRAVTLLQEFIKENYLKRYPQLENVINKTYESKKEFDLDIKKYLAECFTMKFVPIRQDILQEGLQEEKFYLFEIKNKDLSKYSTGKKNIHTMYWQSLFEKKNLEKPVLALNGGGQIFFRKGQKDKLNKKRLKSGKEVFENQRYAEDKYFLHVSITINYGKPKNSKIKELINTMLVKNDVNIIGIKRGERNLLYYCVVNPKGEILEQKSLNIINGVDYNAKLEEKQHKRNEARLNWEEIGNIKNFKEGYMSLVINKIYELIIKYNGVVVIDDLGVQFRADRVKIEKAIYKKFEFALAKKLNHLVLKNRGPGDKGEVLNAYQITPKIEPGKIGYFEKTKQWGILLYVNPRYVAITDPFTGWRKHIFISTSETVKKIREYFIPKTGIQIQYDTDKKCFKFTYVMNDNSWDLYAFHGLERVVWNQKEKKTEIYDLYEEFEKLFIGVNRAKNINEQIFEKEFEWEKLANFWNILNTIKNINKEKITDNSDFLQSPVWSEKYKQFFDSRKVIKNTMPENADANGAYNIARKGIVIVQRIKKSPDVLTFGDTNNRRNPENGYYISDGDWDSVASDWDGFIKKNK